MRAIRHWPGPDGQLVEQTVDYGPVSTVMGDRAAIGAFPIGQMQATGSSAPVRKTVVMACSLCGVDFRGLPRDDGKPRYCGPECRMVAKLAWQRERRRLRRRA